MEIKPEDGHMQTVKLSENYKGGVARWNPDFEQYEIVYPNCIVRPFEHIAELRDHVRAIIMPSYRVQEACSTCAHVFIKQDIDCPDTYYCHQDKSERPLCNSILMDEYPNEDEFEESTEKWFVWLAIHSVRPWGICENYQPAGKDE